MIHCRIWTRRFAPAKVVKATVTIRAWYRFWNSSSLEQAGIAAYSPPKVLLLLSRAIMFIERFVRGEK